VQGSRVARAVTLHQPPEPLGFRLFLDFMDLAYICCLSKDAPCCELEKVPPRSAVRPGAGQPGNPPFPSTPRSNRAMERGAGVDPSYHVGRRESRVQARAKFTPPTADTFSRKSIAREENPSSLHIVGNIALPGPVPSARQPGRGLDDFREEPVDRSGRHGKVRESARQENRPGSITAIIPSRRWHLPHGHGEQWVAFVHRVDTHGQNTVRPLPMSFKEKAISSSRRDTTDFHLSFDAWIHEEIAHRQPFTGTQARFQDTLGFQAASSRSQASDGSRPRFVHEWCFSLPAAREIALLRESPSFPPWQLSGRSSALVYGNPKRPGSQMK